MSKVLLGTAVLILSLLCLADNSAAQIVTGGNSSYVGGRESDMHRADGMGRMTFDNTVQYLEHKSVEGRQQRREIAEQTRRLKEYGEYSPDRFFEFFYSQRFTPNYPSR